MLQINGITYRIGGHLLFDDASVAVPDGHHVGLVGRNGSGKSTLLNLIAGEVHPDGGSIVVPPRRRIGMMAQQAPSGQQSPLECVLAADTERAGLLAEAETATAPQRIAEIHARLEDIAAHSAEARAATILAGLGFDTAGQTRPVDDLSGGWRMRVALAAILFSAPDLLLMDEPSNHLDLEAVIWLGGFLNRYPHTLILVSHDRTLLNACTGTTIHVSQGKLELYSGNFDRYLRTRAEREAHRTALASRQTAERERIQSFVDRFRAKATKARQAQSRLKALERMEPIAAVIAEVSTTLAFPTPKPLSPPILALEDVAVGYTPGQPVLRNLNLRIDMDDRIALLGANGNGKSTFVKLLAGRLQPESGTLRRAAKLGVGYFAQTQEDELDLDASPYEHILRLAPELPPAKLRAHLGRFGFAQSKADVKVSGLSGGERARLLFALMARQSPQLILLDEPTNHLDMEAREALIQAINAFEGAVVIIGHDAHLIETTADNLWLVSGGTVQPFDGDLAAYSSQMLSERRAANRNGEDKARSDGGQKRAARRDAAQRRGALAALRNAARTAEQEVGKLTKACAALEQELAAPEIYDGPTARMQEIALKLARTRQRLATAEATWLKAAETLETSEADA